MFVHLWHLAGFIVLSFIINAFGLWWHQQYSGCNLALMQLCARERLWTYGRFIGHSRTVMNNISFHTKFEGANRTTLTASILYNRFAKRSILRTRRFGKQSFLSPDIVSVRGDKSILTFYGENLIQQFSAIRNIQCVLGSHPVNSLSQPPLLCHTDKHIRNEFGKMGLWLVIFWYYRYSLWYFRKKDRQLCYAFIPRGKRAESVTDDTLLSFLGVICEAMWA